MWLVQHFASYCLLRKLSLQQNLEHTQESVSGRWHLPHTSQGSAWHLDYPWAAFSSLRKCLLECCASGSLLTVSFQTDYVAFPSGRPTGWGSDS